VGKSHEIEYLALRLDSDGDILWRFDFGDYPDEEAIGAVLTLEDGGYLLGGRKGNPPISTDAWLIRTEPDPEFNSVTLLDPAFPSTYSLSAPYPNPFNGTVHLGYALPEAATVELGIYDLAGRLITRLASCRREAGEYSLVWKGADSPTGLYLVRLQTGGRIETQRMLLLK
jgi:hypothetical protein